jgi:hypothetical protein
VAKISSLKITALAIAVVMLGAIISAQAGSFGRPCTAAARDQRLPLDALLGKVEALGYQVEKAKLKNSCGELSALDKSGNRVELFVDPASGKIVGQQ